MEFNYNNQEHKNVIDWKMVGELLSALVILICTILTISFLLQTCYEIRYKSDETISAMESAVDVAAKAAGFSGSGARILNPDVSVAKCSYFSYKNTVQIDPYLVEVNGRIIDNNVGYDIEKIKSSEDFHQVLNSSQRKVLVIGIIAIIGILLNIISLYKRKTVLSLITGVISPISLASTYYFLGSLETPEGFKIVINNGAVLALIIVSGVNLIIPLIQLLWKRIQLSTKMKKCPYCAEQIELEIAQCPYCNEIQPKVKSIEKKKSFYDGHIPGGLGTLGFIITIVLVRNNSIKGEDTAWAFLIVSTIASLSGLVLCIKDIRNGRSNLYSIGGVIISMVPLLLILYKGLLFIGEL